MKNKRRRGRTAKGVTNSASPAVRKERVARKVYPKTEGWEGLIATAFKDGYTVAKIARALKFKRMAVEAVLRKFVRPGGK